MIEIAISEYSKTATASERSSRSSDGPELLVPRWSMTADLVGFVVAVMDEGVEEGEYVDRR